MFITRSLVITLSCTIVLRVLHDLFEVKSPLPHSNFLETHHSPALNLLLCYVRHITFLFHTYNSFNGNFDGCISYPIYWSSLLDESCNSLAQASQNEGLTAVWNKEHLLLTK